jgi:ring-1,2-phenylacetyl-CoA epoxidase subunit PaaE
MTPTFNTLTIQDVRQETNDCISVALHIPEALKTSYDYKAGQYITFKQTIDGEELRRSYSVCSSPLDNELRVAIKKVEQGKFSTYANTHFKKGDSVEVMNPMGHFTIDVNKDNNNNYMGFAAGSGITPLLSIVKTILATETESTFTLVYGNKNVGSIIFKEELEALKNVYLQRFQLIHVLSRERMESELNYGRIDATKCTQLFDKLIDLKKLNAFYMCGPEEMVNSVKEFLVENKVDEKNIHFELFGTNLSKNKTDWAKNHVEDTTKKSRVSVKLDDRTFEFDLAYGGENILDAALRFGADLPYACKGGVCCTCRAKVIEGEVDMEVNYALEKEEVAQGFVLTCQAHPKSDKVFIDFDIK